MSVTNLLYIKLLLLHALVLSGKPHENHPTDCTGSLLPSDLAVTSKYLEEDGMVSPEGCLARYSHCGKRFIPNYPSSDDKLPSDTNSTTISSTLRHPLSCTPCAQPTGIQHSDLTPAILHALLVLLLACLLICRCLINANFYFIL